MFGLQPCDLHRLSTSLYLTLFLLMKVIIDTSHRITVKTKLTRASCYVVSTQDVLAVIQGMSRH